LGKRVLLLLRWGPCTKSSKVLMLLLWRLLRLLYRGGSAKVSKVMLLLLLRRLLLRRFLGERILLLRWLLGSILGKGIMLLLLTRPLIEVSKVLLCLLLLLGRLLSERILLLSRALIKIAKALLLWGRRLLGERVLPLRRLSGKRILWLLSRTTERIPATAVILLRSRRRTACSSQQIDVRRRLRIRYVDHRRLRFTGPLRSPLLLLLTLRRAPPWRWRASPRRTPPWRRTSCWWRRLATVPRLFLVLATDPSTQLYLIIVSLRRLHPVALGIVSSQPQRVDLLVVHQRHLFYLLRRKRRMADSFDAMVELTVDSCTGHANESTDRHVDTRRKLAVTVGAFLVGR
jgi:hypothetical protein